jgi:RNA polymerase sigma factor (sigma-70 family)
MTTARAGRVPADEQARLATLLESARDGDRGALAELVRELTPVLWQVARSQGLDQERAIDVVQTAWLHLLGSLRDIRSPQALTGWLITVTRRESWRARDDDRSELPTEHDVFAKLPDPGPAPEDHVLDGDRAKVLWAAVNRLPRRCQQLLRIVAFVHRPDYEAVSTALGMPRGSIGPTRGRCLAKLRGMLTGAPGRSWL